MTVFVMSDQNNSLRRNAFPGCGQAFVHAIVVLTLTALLVPTNSDAQNQKERDLFEINVRPLLVKHCIQCHGETKQEGKLKLTTLESLLTGGESGPAMVPGKPNESLIIEALRYESLEMPPDDPLGKESIDGLANWIQSGAKWPKGLVLKPTPKITDKDRDWWCYQPLVKQAVPQVKDNDWCKNEIDHFIFDRLAKEGFPPSPEARPGQLIRRVHFGVTGLPPNLDAHPIHIDGEPKNDWYEKLVDELLKSPSYGENQARYWLDLVRYADSDGYNADHARPEAYHYRDYVIRAFNQDKRYDRFILEQLAGDEIDPGNRNALIATMYLRHWIYEWNQRDVEGQWQQILSDVTETTADVFLAQGLKCARCHDHKFDPLLQKDYFAFKSFFAPLHPRENQPIADVETREKYLQQMKKWERATENIRQELHAIERPVLLANATREGFKKFTKEIRDMISAPPRIRTAYEHQIASLASNQFDLHPEKLPQWLDKETEVKRQKLRKQLAEFDKLKPKPLPTLKFVATDVGPTPPPTTIPDSETRTPIEPAFPVILETGPAQIIPPHQALRSTGRRTALAKWIVDPKNPLTARVIVNRIWQQHFGRGLVETTSDFGHLGTPPSHPELLDWLALRFMKDGWSLKKLHRLILTSATYRQSSERASDESLVQKLAKADPQNVLLWRMNPRRLSAEEIHDCLLSASGEMTKGKRAIYKSVKRNQLDPLLATFDFPDRVESRGVRHKTTTSPQALWLMNDPWIHERAKAMTRLSSNSSAKIAIQNAYRRLYYRHASDDELQKALTFLKAYQSITPVSETPKRVAPFPSGSEALVLNPKQPATVTLPAIRKLQNPNRDGVNHNGDFTIEATVLLRSLYPDASVRTIVANWSNKNTDRGWSLGVTSTKSAYKPRNLILQLVGSRKDKDGKPEYEVVPSNLRLELNKPYRVAVSIDLHESEKGITFYVQDLSNPNAKLLVANVKHLARWKVQANRPIEIGERSGKHRWDGLIQNVKLYKKALVRRELFGMDRNPKNGTETNRDSKSTIFDLDFSNKAKLGIDRSGNARHARVSFSNANDLTPFERAKVAMLHALLCSNEAIYVD